MGISADGWFDWGIRDPGHPDKKYAEKNQELGLVAHSAEGYITALRNLVKDWNRKASWTGSIAFDGTAYFHYPVTASVWTSGSKTANVRFFAFEFEGRASVDGPITLAQQETALRIIRDWMARTGRTPSRAMPGRTMWEHRECVAEFGGGATSCPSGRMDPLWARLGELGGDTPMTPEEKERFDALEAFTNELARAVYGADGDVFASMIAARRRITDTDTRLRDDAPWKSLAERMQEHFDTPHEGTPSGIPQHKHAIVAETTEVIQE